MLDIQNKTAFITGAAGGIGLGIARALAREGARVVLADIDTAEVEKSAAALAADGAQTLALSFDVADPAAWPRAKAQAEQVFGPVRILCNNAGVFAAGGPVEDIDPQTWRWLFGINLDAHLHALRIFLPEMRASGEEAHIVNTVSMAGLLATAQTAAYSASKFAALALAQSLRAELEGSRIGISVLCPGYAATRLAATSQQHLPDASRDATDTAAFAAALAKGMAPDEIGASVARAVKSGEFYIFTHPEFREVIEGIQHEQLAAFGAPA
ncbi:putative oxidoreductase EphD [Acidocella aquatica]|uniref:Oxidoreductase EphD n=1 Tax=Acidocella aquatica TaxID=1922313 RepID=A0ABQ6A5F7_9PROT|nr:SDR family NAD(P)-dependent oxidoreductase [Acidocella aquatica]GLR65448.1 putative oxidoreductase EphD [Acidocella aquatica]